MYIYASVSGGWGVYIYIYASVSEGGVYEYTYMRL